MKKYLLLFFSLILSQNNLSLAAPILFIKMKKEDQTLFLVGDFHEPSYENCSVSFPAMEKFDELIKRVADHQEDKTLLIWEMSSRRHQEKNIETCPLYIAQRALQIKKNLQTGLYPHLRYETADDIRTGTAESEKLMDLIGELRLEHESYFDFSLVQKNQENFYKIGEHLQNPCVREKIIEHINRNNKILKLSKKEANNIHFENRVHDYLEKSQSFLKWLNLFSSLNENRKLIDKDFLRQKDFFILYPPNMEALFQVFFAKEKTCILYMGSGHFDYKSKWEIPNILEMLKKLGFEEINRSETRFVDIDF